MSDLISRQAAIDDIHRALDRETCLYSFVRKVAVDAIKTMPSAQPEPQWIPCSERLPEENQICIVTDETRQNTYEYRFCKLTYDEEQGWTYLKHRIIAWMPLPKPWKGEQE